MMQRILAVVAGLLVIATLGGWGHEARPARVGEPAAARAVEAVTSDQPDAADLLPTDFPAVMGYRPAVVRSSGRAEPTRADGGCSSPFGGTPYHFGADCKRHDLGYDLLRYANVKGQPLGPWARKAVDAHFARQTHQQCHEFGCRVMASIYTAVVRFNSWRQGYRTPTFEPLISLARPVIAGLIVALLLGALPLSRLRRLVGPWVGRLVAGSRGASAATLRWPAAAVMLALALQPGLLPHPVWVQAVIGGVAAAQGYALAALVGAVTRRASRSLTDRPATWAPAARRWAGWIAVLGSTVLLVTAAITAHAGQLRVAARTEMAGSSLLAEVTAVLGAVLVAACLVGIGAGVRRMGRMALSLGRAPRRALALAVVPVLALAGCGTLPADPTPPGAAGSRNGRLSESLGVKGELFIGSRPDAASISAVTGRPARTPVRVYVGRDAASTPTARAALAVAALERAGGFERSAVLIDVPTGSGWVNPSAARALEDLCNGDVATVVMQYAASPSWLAYLRGGEGVQSSVRALTDAIAAQVDRLPARQRPKLLAYGESLGAWGGIRAYSDPDGIGRRIDGALWVGVPGSDPAERPADPRIRLLMHSDDPVPAWSPRLILHGSPAWHRRWLPIVSFWQATGDVISVPQTPKGFGHKYGTELVGAWRSVLDTVDRRPAGQALRTVRREVHPRDG